MASQPIPVLPDASELRRYSSSPPDMFSPVVRYHANERAQYLVYDAWEAPTASGKFAILHQALDIFPFSVDALAAWADVYARFAEGDKQENLIKAEQTYQLALQASRLLWPDLEQQEKIEWGYLEYRPFLRSYHGLGVVQERLGRIREAIETHRFLLKVNPDDNQGARILLFHALLQIGDYQEAEAVAEKFSDGRKSREAYFQYGFVVIDFLKFTLGSCTKEALRETMVHALQTNMWVPFLLLGDIPLPQKPDTVSPGSMDEATSLVASVKTTWERIPGLMEWLREQREFDGKMPGDDGTVLFQLLKKGRVVVVLRSNQRMVLTSNVALMPGRALPEFCLAPGMKNHNPSRIVAFREDNFFSNRSSDFLQKFTSFPYSEVDAVPFWKILETSDSFGREDGTPFCHVCYEPATLKCSACKVNWYCSKECQKKDWNNNRGHSQGHKVMCKKFIKT
mmetsp:Transcript_24742/g.46190  ORF Transcript_24742/g.46190 Transcript_24742/m.46190 type:complete len:453 (-) Transcript_24742:683-2041(-)